MSETLDYIDAYFSRELRDSERQQFGARCASDEEFAKEVAFYISAREVAREALLQQKEQWQPAITMQNKKPAKKPMVLKFIPYAAAACLLFAIASYFLFRSPSAEQLAANYIKDNYAYISQSMDASKDSVQLGISEYNNKDYSRALTLFEWAQMNDSTNSDAKKYAGLAYLQLKDYDKAIACFKSLSAMKSLYSNSGDILQATALLQRNAPNDEEQAKELMKKVVKEKEEGNGLASEVLAKLNEKVH